MIETVFSLLRQEGVSLFRFCLVGAFGFLIDAWVLIVLSNGLELNPIPARVISILTAMTATWMLHRRFTFGSDDTRKLREWTRFLAVNGFGAGVNFAAYTIILVAFTGTPPLLALAIGSAAALAINYLGSRLWAFKGSPNPA